MSVLDELRGGLIVSVQAWPGSSIDDSHVLAAMARAAQEGGAVAVRVQGAGNLHAVRARVELPIVGLIKREYRGFEPYITPTLAEVTEVIDAGAEIVAFDATARPRPDGVTPERLIEAIHARGRLAMADCATLKEGRTAAATGADVVATTLCGYTPQTKGHALPAIDLVAALRKQAGIRFVVCEGGVHRPAEVRAALDAGADAVVVGTAITNVDWLVREFAGSTDTVRNRYR
jgi:N-acylglucosamine-6-phosphate 2-epimerase